MKHELKTWPSYFEAIWIGDKTFEIRKNDRGFHERDEIILQEWDNQANEYTGREINGVITWLTKNWLMDGYVAFSFRATGRTES